MEAQNKKPEQPDKAMDRAGTGQTDEEKGIASKEAQEQKRKELEEEGKAKRRPHFNGGEDDEEQPLQLKE